MLFNGNGASSSSEADQTDDDDIIHIQSSSNGIGSRQSSRNLISSTKYEITDIEQSDMAKAMKHELKSLKTGLGIIDPFTADSAVQTENEEETPRADRQRMVGFHNFSSESLPETAGLRMKLENITEKINRIREGLHEKSEDSVLAEINEQLTDIQDHIEDAENDVENHIESTIGKLQTENQRNRQKIKSLKKERKDREESERLRREREQKEMIERQRLHIENLQKHTATLQTPMKPSHHGSNSMQLDRLEMSSPVEMSKSDPRSAESHFNRSQGSHGRSNSMDRSRSQYYVVDDDNASDDEFNDEYGAYNPGHMAGAMTAPPGPGQFEDPTVIGVSFAGPEGTTHPHMFRQQHMKRPLLSDNAIKIFAGAVVALSVLYIAHKWLSGDDKSGRGSFPKVGKRAPRIRY